MYKLLIVDDEMISRVGISNMLNWEEHGFSLIESVGNGEEALKALQSNNIDLVITDVKMPILDGIELIRRAKESDYNCFFIVMSSYDDFQYVRDSFLLGVVDYVLKCDLNKDSVIKLLDKAKVSIKNSRKPNVNENYAEEKTTALILQRETLKRIFFQRHNDTNSVSEECEKAQIVFDGTKFCVVSVKIPNEFISHTTKIFDFFEALLNEYQKSYIVQTTMGEITVLYSPTKDDEKLADNYIDEIAQRISLFTKNYFDFGSQLYVSRWINQTENLPEGYMQVHRLADYIGKTNCLRYDMVEKWFANEYRNDVFDLIVKAKEIQTIDELFLLVEKCLIVFETAEYLQLERVKELFLLFVVFAKKNINVNNINKSEILDSDYFKCETIQMAIEQFRGFSAFLEENTKLADYNYIVRATKNFIDQNFDKGIKIKDVSNEVGFSNSYLSALFHQVTGQTMKDYFLNVQFLKAKELLINTNLLISEVAKASGFNDEQHFSRIFKQKFGSTPTLFRNQNRKL